MTTYSLESTVETVTDYFSAATDPVLTIAPGDTIIVHTLDANGHTEPQQSPGESRPTLIPDTRGHCLVGPIAVEGATTGQTLAVHFRDLRPDDWGFTSSGRADTPLNHRLGLTGHGHDHSAALLWSLDTDNAIGTNQLGLSVPLAPFLGVIGMPPEANGEHSTIPPRSMGGGNIDCRELVAGSTLYLPVTVPGALVSFGDGHAAQGDGEVSGTAIECGMTAELTLDLVVDRPLMSIHATTPAGLITFGFDADLNEATATALEAMVTWIQKIHEINKPQALAMASVAVSLRVTQVANETWGVHALLPTGAIVGG
jgi:acetamidase/formamidase